jgi:hypothetical protein
MPEAFQSMQLLCSFFAVGPATLVACILDSPCITCAVLWAVVNCGSVIQQGWISDEV